MLTAVRFRPAGWAGVLLTLGCVASAHEDVPVEATARLLLPADTEVHLRLLEPVASNTHKRGDRFGLEVVEPVRVGDAVVIPAAARGEGEVVHAARGGFGGRAGELILVSRIVRSGDQLVKLRSFSAGNGQDRVDLAMALSFAVIGIFVTGKDISLPAGTEVFAKVATDSLLPSASATGPASVNSASFALPTPPEIDHNEEPTQH